MWKNILDCCVYLSGDRSVNWSFQHFPVILLTSKPLSLIQLYATLELDFIQTSFSSLFLVLQQLQIF